MERENLVRKMNSMLEFNAINNPKVIEFNFFCQNQRTQPPLYSYSTALQTRTPMALEVQVFILIARMTGVTHKF
uniref:Uncharacterized protein n=1 Tax=Cucumis sativus TaxID=3659 RepID=A0A0A0KKW2_CUCSA